MKRKDPAVRLQAKKASLAERTAKILSVSGAEAVNLLRTSRLQSARLRAGSKPTYMGDAFAWCKSGYALNLPVNIVRDEPEVLNGSVYIQNAASWLPVLALDPRPTDVILDVCAAPGGKTSHIRDLAGPDAEIWANDNSRGRLAKLQTNMHLLGVQVDEYTLFDATQLARKLVGRQFTKILLDVPCSGEGMMHLDRDKDFNSWSVAHIKRLQQLQKRIIIQAWRLLAPGGTLVYSTCTMAPEENEAVVDYLLRTNDDANIESIDITLPNQVETVKEWNSKVFNPELSKCLRLQPSERIEAFFVCKLTKSGHLSDN